MTAAKRRTWSNEAGERGRRDRKTDSAPAARAAKVSIRANVLDLVGSAKAHVFDAFAGAGEMHDAVWAGAASYVGCDLQFYRDDRLAFVADNLRVLRSIDLAPFTIFDFDAYGSPWEQCMILAARRPLLPGERLGLVLTEGSGLDMRLRGLPTVMAHLAGMHPHATGVARSSDEIINRCIAGLTRRMHATVERRWQAVGKSGAGMRYIGLVLQREFS